MNAACTARSGGINTEYFGPVTPRIGGDVELHATVGECVAGNLRLTKFCPFCRQPVNSRRFYVSLQADQINFDDDFNAGLKNAVWDVALQTGVIMVSFPLAVRADCG
jgi:hypothetical protein